MPPLFRMKIEVNKGLLDWLRSTPARAKQIFKTKLRTELAPELEELLQGLAIPGPVSEPFAFGSEKSRLYYIIYVRENPGLTTGGSDPHWIRGGDIENSFHVKVADRIGDNLISVYNNHPKAKYVYGPWLVAGHAITGWPREAQVARELLRERVNVRVRELWRESVREALRNGRGS